RGNPVRQQLEHPQGHPSMKTLRALAFCFLGSLSGWEGCTRSTQENSPHQVKSISMSNSVAPNPIAQNFQQAELVFVGRPVEILGSPGVWSGAFASYQAVRYLVTRVLKGDDLKAGAELLVLHPLVQGAKLVDADQVRLAPAIFAVGRDLLVFAERHGDEVICI